VFASSKLLTAFVTENVESPMVFELKMINEAIFLQTKLYQIKFVCSYKDIYMEIFHFDFDRFQIYKIADNKRHVFLYKCFLVRLGIETTWN